MKLIAKILNVPLLLLVFICFSSFPLNGRTQDANLLSDLSIKALKGQSDQQKNKDSMHCAEVTKGQLEKLKNEEQGNSSQNKRSGVGRGAARGAAAGSIRGEIVSGDPGRGAAVGAVGGGIRAVVRRRRIEKKEKEAKEKAGKQAFALAFATCMQERGYSVNY